MRPARASAYAGRCAAACATALILSLHPAPASAHQISATYGRLEATPDPARVRYEIQIAARDLAPPASDRVPTAEEIESGRLRLADFLTERIRFAADGRPCRAALASLVTVEQSQRMVQASFDVTCPGPIDELTLDYKLFFDRDPRHIGFVLVGGATARLAAPDDTRLVWHVGGDAPAGLLGFIASGVEHILVGLDHILFLVSLLLMAVVTGTRPGRVQAAEHRHGNVVRAEAVVRRPREALAYAGAIVTSFTVAHSLTLIGAALGWFDLPGRLVESAIAASILFVAVDNAVRFDPPRRYVITFLFGLLHGLGFASMLRPLLPPEQVVLPLLAFNVGVELGQLGLVVVSLPLLYGLVRVAGAARYRRVVLPAMAALLGGIALVWLVERAFDLQILGL